jgi:solute:Na+ symporter, SSS family
VGEAVQEGLASGFSGIDWAIVLGLLLLATLIGGPLAGRQATIRDFFLGGRKLPWFAVSGSIIATEISAVTLISLPWVVYRPGGDFTYLQLGLIGGVLARFLVAWFLVPAYYEREIYSPYDYIGARLGARARSMATAVFALGGVLAQSTRVFMTALVLDVLLHDELRTVSERLGVPSLWLAIAAIGLVAVAWTFLGGIATVVWTDTILFLIFVATPIIALVTIAGRLEGGFDLIREVGFGAQKFRFWNFDPSPAEPYTFWAAVIGVTWMSVAAFGTDQMMAQRMFCCRSVRDARLAIVVSSVGIVVTVLVAFVGVGLFAYYERHPLTGDALRLFELQGDRIFPIFIDQVVPTGLKGLIVAGVFAAAISSLDSIMAALSQTVLSAVYVPWRERVLRRRGADPAALAESPEEARRSVRVSRLLVVLFGVLLCWGAVLMQKASAGYDSILDLALAMATYTQGALLAGFLLAFLRLDVDGSGFLWSAPLSVLTVFGLAWHAPWAVGVSAALAWSLLASWIALRVLPDLFTGRRAGLLGQTVLLLLGLSTALWLARWGRVSVLGEVEGENAWVRATVAWPWYVPVGCTVAFAYGYLLSRRRAHGPGGA